VRPTRLVLIFILAAAGVSTDYVAALPVCQTIPVPLSLESLKKPFEVTNSWLSVDSVDGLVGGITLRNQTGKPLSRLTVMVNYLDENRSILFSMPYQANLPTEKNHLSNIRPFSELELSEPVSPGKEVSLLARNLLHVTRMPATAEIIFWLAKYDDGSISDDLISQRGFRTDPILVETPEEYLQVGVPYPSEPIKVWLTAHINEYGRVLTLKVVPESNLGLSEAEFRSLSRQVAEWHFFPAVENGYAASSDLCLLIEFLPEKPLPVRHCFAEDIDKRPAKFAIVTLQPVGGAQDQWIPYYGSFPARGKLEPNRIATGRYIDH
jgi:hypothetical protein